MGDGSWHRALGARTVIDKRDEFALRPEGVVPRVFDNCMTGATEAGEQAIATAQVSGSFPGSPAQIRYRFTLKDGKIAALAIGT